MPTTKQQNIPKLRFPGFSGEWEEMKFGEVFDIRAGGDIDKEHLSKERNDKFKYPVYANADKNRGLYGYSDIYRIDENCITVTGRGNLGVAVARFEKFYPIVRLLILKPKKKADIKFFEFCINQTNFFVESTGVPQLTGPQLSIYKIKFPSLPEQQKIADFLGTVDEWITTLRQQKESLDTYKKGMMQKIFSREIRFKDEKGKDFLEWEEKKLGDCLDYKQPTNYIVESTEYNDKNGTPVLTAGKTFILGYTDEKKGVFEEDHLPVIIFDDFTTASQFVNFPFKVKSSAMKILKEKKDANIRFIYEAMQLIDYKVGGHGRHWISKYSNLIINAPSLIEQQKIADFLTGLDNLINLKKQQIDLAEQWKKGLMQGMFV